VRESSERQVVEHIAAAQQGLEWLLEHRSPGRRSVYQAWANHIAADLKTLKLLAEVSDEDLADALGTPRG